MAGFTKPTTTQTPDALFDFWLTRLTGPEIRVLLYAIRRIYGFGKESDDISLHQFLHGIRTRDGEVLDEGAGIKKTALLTALKKLTAKELLIKIPHTDPRHGDQPSTFRLNIVDERTSRANSGFRPINTTQVPDELFDYGLTRLTDPELFVLLYIIRRTLGFGKRTDIIRPSQFLHGITKRDGTVLDEGCGVGNKAMYAALNSLKVKGLITIDRRMHPRYGNLASAYSLVFEGELPPILIDRDPRLSDDPDQALWDVAASDPFTSSNRGGGRKKHIGRPQATQREAVTDGEGGRAEHRGRSQVAQRETADDIQGDRAQREGRSHTPLREVAWGSEASMSGAAPQETVNLDNVQETVDQDTPRQETRQQQSPVVVLHSDEEISAYDLGEHEVLIELENGDAEVVSLFELVKRDLDDPAAIRGIPKVTECYYSAQHFLGLGGEDWTPEELRKREMLVSLRRELGNLHREIGAVTIEDALGLYFTADLIGRFHSDDPAGIQRIRGWLRYVRSDAGKNLQNPAGFLRSCLESDQWPPRGGARTRSQ